MDIILRDCVIYYYFKELWSEWWGVCRALTPYTFESWRLELRDRFCWEGLFLPSLNDGQLHFQASITMQDHGHLHPHLSHSSPYIYLGLQSEKQAINQSLLVRKGRWQFLLKSSALPTAPLQFSRHLNWRQNSWFCPRSLLLQHILFF